MKKIAYLECPTGLAGDMCLGALVHAGVPLDYLRSQLAKLGISHEYHLWAEQIYHNGQLATKVHVDLLLDETLDHDHSNHHQRLDRSQDSHNFSQEDSSLDRPPEQQQKPDLHLLDNHANSRAISHTTNHDDQHSHSHQHHTHSYDSAHAHHTHIHDQGELDQDNSNSDDSASHNHAPHDHPPHDHLSHNHATHDHATHDHATHGHQDHQSRHRHLPEITQLINQADLPTQARDWSLAVFQRLAIAEGAVHGVPADQVYFHEVGATDAIVDIVGTCLGLDWLGIEELYCSAMPTGGGTIWAAHGRLPVPVPAVLQLWQSRHCPIYSNGIEKELVTPTGAALAVTLVESFGAPPTMNLHAIGLGAGSQQLPIPNILRLWIGEKQGIVCQKDHQQQVFTKLSHYPDQQLDNNSKVNVANLEDNLSASKTAFKTISEIPVDKISAPALETIAVLETQIDDLNPQAISYACDRLLQAGALDVFTQGITMKKSRLGTLLTVITPVAKISECEAIIFQETSTLGIRRSQQSRSILQRELQSVNTTYGIVRVKVAWQEGGNISNVQPEYEDCAAIARESNLPWRQIHAAALQNWQEAQT